MFSKPTFNPTTDIPSLTGKVILVTGGTAGLGRSSILALAAHEPAHIFFTGRSQASATAVMEEAKSKPESSSTSITFIPCDLADLSSVQRAAQAILRQAEKLDIAMMNAGVMALPPGQTKDGYEIQFGTNHVGQALLLRLLTPLLLSTAATPTPSDVRVIWTTSQGYRIHPKDGILFPALKTPQADISLFAGAIIRYGQSKLANLLYARAYATHHPSITCVSLHPGVSATGLVTSMGWMYRALVYVTCVGKMVSAEECAWNQLWAATAAGEAVVSGRYYEPVGVETAPGGEGSNDELADRLWEWTEKELEGWQL
ncbi:hypothetical protein LTR08_002324 [Meristemomyces frigidus]|nr:hypothetical protein LTR08_002324 [Meristemomyces frigidus]